MPSSLFSPTTADSPRTSTLLLHPRSINRARTPPHLQCSYSSDMSEDNSIELVRIGSGTFGTVYFNTAAPEVFKKCRSLDGCATLAEEYQQLKIISRALQTSGNSILAPTPFEFYGHTDLEFWNDPTLTFPEEDSARTCVYSMSRVYPMPSKLKAQLINLFCPTNLRDRAQTSLIRRGHHVARLLLGRADPDPNRSAPQRFFDTYNFPLTRGRAQQLGINTVDIAGDMGRMLAQLHMSARNDARDIEVVLGANITSTVLRRREPRVWVIDFNQVRKFDFTDRQIPLLVDGFLSNEAYFPRARRADSLYVVFADAYLEECQKIGDVAGQLGQLFIAELEAEQSRKDSSRTPK